MNQTTDKSNNSRLLRVFVLICFVSIGCQENIKPLNVIVVLVDDMGYGDIAANGNTILKTPNFDKLHEESIRFTNFAVSPTCAPTRAALMTGSHEFLVGVTHTRQPMNLMDTTAVTIAELFQKKGYRTGLFGKWHLGQAGPYGPWFRGFDETLTVPNDNQDSHYDPVLLQNRTEKRYTGYREDILFDEAMKFISANNDQPFFCYVPTYSPHTPNKVPEKYSSSYDGYINSERPHGEYRAGFFGQVVNVDENLGKLRAFLDSLALADNTLLIVMNDNGGTMGVDAYNSGMRGVKTTPYRGGTRAYSYWKWGDHFAPGERSLMCGHIDILPTLADLCDLDVSKNVQRQLQGNSLKRVLEYPDAELDDSMQITHIGRWSRPEQWVDHKYGGCSVRWKNYTLVRHELCDNKTCRTCITARKRGLEMARPLYTSNNDHYRLTEPGQWELYDIEADPHQDKNIASVKQNIVKKMSKVYERWWTKVEAKMTEKWGRGG